MLQSSNFHAEPAGYATSLFQYIRHFKNISCLTKCVILLLDMVLISNNRFLGMGNHLGPFSEASDQPEGQELGGGAVGGQEVLQEAKF